jgi:YebC/PmpR family DNA-binding regulatory protein
MSGHSKWSKVKHQKATTDAVKSSLFTKASRAITVAVSEGGGIGDPNKNFRLRLAIEKAHDVNMPKDRIERAIEHGTSPDAQSIENYVYEGYAPGGIALLIEAMTDNKQRTVSQVKNTLEKAGGTLASPGSVLYLFDQVGLIVVPCTIGKNFDELLEIAIRAGADELISKMDVYELYTHSNHLREAKDMMTAQMIPIESTRLIMRPKQSVAVSAGELDRVEMLIAQLENLDDVHMVYSNIGE